MTPRVDDADRELLLLLQRGGGATVQDACETMGVTATAVRNRLDRLHAAGFVAREAVRAGRGRPHYVYRPTESGFRELGENYSELAFVLWDAVSRLEEPSVKSRVLEHVRQSMVARYGGAGGSTLEARFAGLAESLGEHGFDVELDSSGDLPILRENSCPYHELASADDSICELERSVFEEVLGTTVERSQCCLDGDRYCEFTPVPGTAKE